MPMKRRQKKIQEFQDALKVGDKVVTTSGIYGQITKVNEKSVQVQIADKVRIEVARAAIGGYQGQEPVVADNSVTSQQLESCTKTFAGKSSPSSPCSSCSSASASIRCWPITTTGRCPAVLKAKQLKLGLDLKGGVQLRLKVNTDDALKLTTIGISEQLRDSLKNGGIAVRDHHPARRRPSSGSTASRRTRTRRSGGRRRGRRRPTTTATRGGRRLRRSR